MKTPYNKIVISNEIGAKVNSVNLADLISLAESEGFTPGIKNAEQVLVVAIDFQQDFMENGSLGVPGSHGDIARATKWIYDNMDKVGQIIASVDTHSPWQIFFPCWWMDKNGNQPAPFTAITVKDLDDGTWIPRVDPLGSRDYVLGLETKAKRPLVIWPYHCIQGTNGYALENQFTNMLYFFAAAKKMRVKLLNKGQDPLSEMYGIFKPEYSKTNLVNVDYLNFLEKFDKIVFMGEAKSHCVLETILQAADWYGSRPEVTSKMYVLEDCMSTIPGSEQATADCFENFKKKYKINIVNSGNFSL